MNDRAVEGLVDRLKAIVGERGIVASAEHGDSTSTTGAATTTGARRRS